MLVRMGEILRYGRPYSTVPLMAGGLRNYFAVTETAGLPLPLLEKGINPIAQVKSKDGSRRPAVLISSSPHKVGSLETPWQDYFDTDRGYIRYNGDAKVDSRDPSSTPGNRILLTLFSDHNTHDVSHRQAASPLIFFERVSHGGREKGFVRFQGFGVITTARRATTYDRKLQQSFVNYVFEFSVLDQNEENDQFNWAWISARRQSSLASSEVLKLAPKSWQRWVQHGSVERVRRHVSHLRKVPISYQRPPNGSELHNILNDIYAFFSPQQHKFEALALRAVGRIMRVSGVNWHEGWITPSTSDGGADFVGRLDVGQGRFPVRQIVLGQAKCESPLTVTSGNHIARTVARLKRGWIGAYVTTSYFSGAVQQEVLEDQYPILLVDGLELASQVQALADEANCSVLDYLEQVSLEYDSIVQHRRPEEILFQLL